MRRVKVVGVLMVAVGVGGGPGLCGGQAVMEPGRSALSAQASPPAQLPQLGQQSRAAQQSQRPQQSQPPRYSADGLYNLANSYARAGKPGLAVLNYERAALLAPNDVDINANLEFTRASARVTSEPRSRFARIGQAVSPTVAAWIGVAGIGLIGLGLLTARISRRFRWARALGIPLGVAMIALTVSNAMLMWPRMHAAVVLLNQTPARVTPVPMGDTAFVLKEAETVTLVANHEEFALIRTREGRSGWVARGSVGAVVP